MTNIVDATDRFGRRSRLNQRSSALDALRKSKRVPLPDRVILAKRLGEIANQLSPTRPHRAARLWFERAWQGDRWAKRRRYICFPGETALDPADEGAYVASGADWAALIEQAAAALAPGDGAAAEPDRGRIGRDILRGTTFLPALTGGPLKAETAQTLLVTLAQKVEARLGDESDIERLWDVLETTPFTVTAYEPERPDGSRFSHLGTAFQEFLCTKSYEGDEYSRSPLGDASRAAAEVAAVRYGGLEHDRFRFEPNGTDASWAIPTLRLGVLGHSRKTRMFVIPQDFERDLPPKEDADIEERVLEWLIAKGLMTGGAYEKLPETEFDEARGFGWREFAYQQVQSVWLEVKRKNDGSPGLWLNATDGDMPNLYPLLPTFDTLAAQAESPRASLGFLPMEVSRESEYEYLSWPTWDVTFMPSGEIPPRAYSGIITFDDYTILPDVTGWLDDLANDELQHLLFAPGPGVRFCPSVATIEEVPPPCRPATIAAALFSNAGCDPKEQIATILLRQAQTLACSGLAFHAALIDYHRRTIEKL